VPDSSTLSSRSVINPSLLLMVYRGPLTSPGPRRPGGSARHLPRDVPRAVICRATVRPVRRRIHPRLWTDLGTHGGYGGSARAQAVDNRVDNTRATPPKAPNPAESAVHTVWKEIGRHIGGQRPAAWGQRSLARPPDPRPRRPRARCARRRTALRPHRLRHGRPPRDGRARRSVPVLP